MRKGAYLFWVRWNNLTTYWKWAFNGSMWVLVVGCVFDPHLGFWLLLVLAPVMLAWTLQTAIACRPKDGEEGNG